MDKQEIKLTDPAPVVSDAASWACSCGASHDRRVMSDSAGPWTWPICRNCGAEFMNERRERGTL